MSEILSLHRFRNKSSTQSPSFSVWRILFFFPYLLRAAEHMTLGTSDSQLKNTPLLLKKTIKKSDWHWRKPLVKRMWSPPSPVTLIPLQWCPRSQRAPEQWPQGLWWHWTLRRSKGKQQAGAQFKKTVRSVKRAKQQSVPGSQKAGKCPYRPNRPGKSWHLKKENLW